MNKLDFEPDGMTRVISEDGLIGQIMEFDFVEDISAEDWLELYEALHQLAAYARKDTFDIIAKKLNELKPFM